MWLTLSASNGSLLMLRHGNHKQGWSRLSFVLVRRSVDIYPSFSVLLFDHESKR